MCWEPCLDCEQCENFKNGCSGQVGTFFKDLCPCCNKESDAQFTWLDF